MAPACRTYRDWLLKARLVMSVKPVQSPKSLWLLVILLLTGLGWGLTISLATIATASGIDPLTVALWSALAGALVLTVVLLASRKRPPMDGPHLRFYLVTGFLGTAFPHALSFYAAIHLPAGVRAIVFALIPMITLVLSIGLSMEKANARRFTGILLGLLAMLVMFLPGVQVPLPGQVFWTLVSLAVATSYAVENVYISLKRPTELDAVTALWGMTVAGTLMLLVTLWLADAPYLLPFEASTAELAILLMAVVHLCAYAGLLYMLSHGGVVFASQVSYIVTPAAVMWGVVLLSEEISLSILLALVLIMGGLALIKPRRKGEE